MATVREKRSRVDTGDRLGEMAKRQRLNTVHSKSMLDTEMGNAPPPQPEEKTDCRKTKVQVWRGDAKLGGDQWETMDDLTDCSDDDGGGDAAPETEPSAKKHKTEECHPQGCGGLAGS